MRMQAVSACILEKSENIFELGGNLGQAAVKRHHDAGTAFGMSRGVPEEEVLCESIFSLPEIQQAAYGDRSGVRGDRLATRTGDLNRRRIYPGSGAPETGCVRTDREVRSVVIPRWFSRETRNDVIQVSIQERKFEPLE